MGKDIKDMGEEEIRAIMDIAKIKITGALGIVFSSLLGMIYIVLNSGKTGGIIGVIALAVLSLLALFIVAKPSIDVFYDFARKLDTLKKNERICINCGQKIEKSQD